MMSVFLSVVLSVPPQAPPVRETYALQQAPPVRTTQPNCGCGWGEPCKCTDGCTCEPLTYSAALDAAHRYHRPLIVFVGCKARPIVGYATCRSSACFDDNTPRIILATWEGSTLNWQVDLPADVSDAAIRAMTVSKMTSRQPVAQFAQPLFMQQPVRMFGGGRGGSC